MSTTQPETELSEADAKEAAAAITHFLIDEPGIIAHFTKWVSRTSPSFPASPEAARDLLGKIHDTLQPECQRNGVNPSLIETLLGQTMRLPGAPDGYKLAKGPGMPPGITDPVIRGLWGNWQACVLHGDTERAAEYREMYSSLLFRRDQITDDQGLSDEGKKALLDG